MPENHSSIFYLYTIYYIGMSRGNSTATMDMDKYIRVMGLMVIKLVFTCKVFVYRIRSI